MPRSGTVEKTSGDSKTVKKPRQVTYKISFFFGIGFCAAKAVLKFTMWATDSCEFTLFLLRFWSARITLEGGLPCVMWGSGFKPEPQASSSSTLPPELHPQLCRHLSHSWHLNCNMEGWMAAKPYFPISERKLVPLEQRFSTFLKL